MLKKRMMKIEPSVQCRSLPDDTCCSLMSIQFLQHVAPKVHEGYTGKKCRFIIAGTPCFVFRCCKFIFDISVEDLNPRVSKLIVSWSIGFFVWFGLVYSVNRFLEEYATLLLKATLPFFLSLTTKLFHTTVSKNLKISYCLLLFKGSLSLVSGFYQEGIGSRFLVKDVKLIVKHRGFL